MTLASVDLGLISFAFTALIAACWALESKKSNERIGKLEADVAELQSHAVATK